MQLSRYRTPLLFFTLLLVAFVASTAWADGSGSGSATVLANPVSDPGGFLAELSRFAHSCWPVAAALIAYGLLEVASKVGKDIAAFAWLGTGRISLVISGGVAVLGAGLNSYIGGASIQTAFWAAVVSAASFWHPAADDVVKMKAKPPEVEPVEKAPQAGRASLAVIALLFAIGIPVAACAWFKSEAKKVEQAAVDCTVGELANVEALAASLAPKVLGGSLSWDDVLSAAIAAGEDVGGCFIHDMEGATRTTIACVDGKPTPGFTWVEATATVPGHWERLRVGQTEADAKCPPPGTIPPPKLSAGAEIALQKFGAGLKAQKTYHTKYDAK